jgi:NitT/TauT family transport system substrate-binding protein
MLRCRLSCRLIGTLLALLVCGGCHQRSRNSNRMPVRMTIGSQTELVYLASTLAQQLGFYKRESLDVVITDASGGSKALEALLGGSADVVTGFYDHTIQMAAEGKHIKAFVEMVRYPGAVAILSPEGAKKVHRIEDLKGVTAGVTAPGSSSHFFLNYLLTKHGLSPSDVSVIGLGANASRVMAIERSKVDLGILFEPGVTQLLHRSPSAVILADTRTRNGVEQVYGTDTYPSAVLYSTADWLKQNPATARHLALAIRTTLEWIQQHSPEQIMEKMPPSFRGGTPAIYLEALQQSMPMFSPDGVMTREGAEAVKKVLAISSDKVRTSNVDVATTYTNQFLDGSHEGSQ